MNERKFDPTKPVQTRDGRKARILATDIKHEKYPISAAVTMGNGNEVVCAFSPDGCFHYERMHRNEDLVNIPEKVKVSGFLNVYPNGVATFHRSNIEATNAAGALRIACVPLDREVTEGEGL